VDSKSVRSGNGWPLIALRCLLLMLVSTPLQIVNRCCSGFPLSGGIKMPGPFEHFLVFVILLLVAVLTLRVILIACFLLIVKVF